MPLFDFVPVCYVIRAGFSNNKLLRFENFGQRMSEMVFKSAKMNLNDLGKRQQVKQCQKKRWEMGLATDKWKAKRHKFEHSYFRNDLF